MKIGIIIAIERELRSFLESDYKIEEVKDNKISYFKTVINKNEVVAIKSGWGMVDAAATTMYLITKEHPDIIINFGVTGALERSLKVSDLFVVEKCVNYDYDVSLIDKVVPHQYEEFKDIFIPLDQSLIQLVQKIEPTIKLAVDCSGDQFIENKEDKLARNAIGCNICDMEIAAIARICYLNDVKCLSIKCISDTFDGGAGDFNTNVRNASDKAFKLITKILNELN